MPIPFRVDKVSVTYILNLWDPYCLHKYCLSQVFPCFLCHVKYYIWFSLLKFLFRIYDI